MYVCRRQLRQRVETREEEIRHRYIGTWDVQRARDTTRRKQDPWYLHSARFYQRHVTDKHAIRDNQLEAQVGSIADSGKISKRERYGTDSNRNNIFLQLLLKMPKLEPKQQLTQKQQRELERKRREKREKAKVQKSKQRSRLTEDAKGLQREKDRVRKSRSRERRSGALEGKAQLPPNFILNYTRGVPLPGKVSLWEYASNGCF